MSTDTQPSTHGLNHDPQLLSTLPVLLPRPDCAPPIRGLTAAQFRTMHTKFLTTHAPDSVIFPFLHGLEGDNEAQNLFFAASSGKHSAEPLVPQVPKFRGLVWVASDEDEAEHIPEHDELDGKASSDASSDLDEELDDDYSTSSEDDDLDAFPASRSYVPMNMDIDVDVAMDVNHTLQGPIVEGSQFNLHEEGAHMHPVHHRPALSAIDTSAGKELPHDHHLSHVSSVSSFTSSAPSLASPAPSSATTPPTPVSALPLTAPCPPCPSVNRPERFTPSPSPPPKAVTLTSTFRPRELLCIDRDTGETKFIDPKVPDGISLRNFGIQVPIFATISDIVVYSPRGNVKAALAVATHFAHAIESKRAQRAARGQNDLLQYNVFVIYSPPEEMARDLPQVVTRMANEIVGSGAHTAGTDASTSSETHLADVHVPAQSECKERCQEQMLRKANTISFAQREKDEMRELTQASEILTFPLDDEACKEFEASNTAAHWDPKRGQVFLGNASDVPLPPSPGERKRDSPADSMFGYNERGRPTYNGVDMDEWDWRTNDPHVGLGYDICIECDEMAPFPSQAHLRAAEEHIAKLEKRWAERCLREMEIKGTASDDTEIPVRPPPPAGAVIHLPFPSSVAYASNSVLPFINWLESLLRSVEAPLTVGHMRERREEVRSASQRSSRRHGSPNGSGFVGPSSLPPPSSFPASFLPPASTTPPIATSTNAAYTRMRSTSATHLITPSPTPPALTPIRTRPLKVLVYSADGYTESSSLALCLLMALRGISLPEAYLTLQVDKRRSFFVYHNEIGPMRRVEARLERERMARAGGRHWQPHHANTAHPGGNFLSSSTSMNNMNSSTLSSSMPGESVLGAVMRRPRASTLPALSTISDHQLWFNDPRFDGSFPSRVLPFLYLGNLNHAANAYMLHALGITHVVSVGECALIPPENGNSSFAAGCATAKPGSLWIEEREGRIKVLDIKGVCDDGIDTLEPQLAPICEWIDQARQEGGKVLVHCRVGVSRSATVTIAYVMKHLNIPLVDAYLIVRSRRLSVLIQPNMRLLYNLVGWELKLAQERAGGDEEKLGEELARCLNWPYLAKEVHALNEKYLH